MYLPLQRMENLQNPNARDGIVSTGSVVPAAESHIFKNPSRP